MNFCTKCGNRLAPGLSFCTRCGTPAAADVASAPQGQDIPVHAVAPEAAEPSQAATPAAQALPEAVPNQGATALPTEAPPASEWKPLPSAAVSQPPASTKSGCLPTVLIVLAALALIAVLGIGGVVYVGYQVKQKATVLLHHAEANASANVGAPTHGDAKSNSPSANPAGGPAGLLGNLSGLLGGEGDDGDLVQSVSDRDPVVPCGPAPYPAQAGARIPLQEGTVITTAWGVKYEDVESRNSLDPGTPTSIIMTNATDAYKADDGHEAKALSYEDTVCHADLASANTYVTVTGQHIPHLIHGVTDSGSQIRPSTK